MNIQHKIRRTSIVVAALILGPLTFGNSAMAAETTQETYLGKLQYQDQTITKASAAKLHRDIDLQHAS